MIISSEDVLEGMITAVRSHIGEELSLMPSAPNTTPLRSVIKDIQSADRPPYPYIVVSIVSNAKQGGAWLRNKIADDQDRVTYIAEQDVSLRVTCYGDQATTILSKLRMYVLDDGMRSDMSQLAGAVFQDYTDIIREPMYLSTDFVNTASMVASFTAVSTWQPPTAGIIERVTGEGRYLDYEGDENPIIVTFDEPS